MTAFIIMTAITLAFGCLLFYAVFKKSDSPATPPDNGIIRKYLSVVCAPVFPEKFSHTVFVSENFLEKFKGTDGFLKLLPYRGLSLVHRIYTLENDTFHVANVFLYNNMIVAVFLSDANSLQFV